MSVWRKLDNNDFRHQFCCTHVSLTEHLPIKLSSGTYLRPNLVQSVGARDLELMGDPTLDQCEQTGSYVALSAPAPRQKNI